MSIGTTKRTPRATLCWNSMYSFWRTRSSDMEGCGEGPEGLAVEEVSRVAIVVCGVVGVARRCGGGRAVLVGGGGVFGQVVRSQLTR